MHLVFGLESGAHHLEAVAGDLPEQSFSHLAARRIAGTEKEYVLFLSIILKIIVN